MSFVRWKPTAKDRVQGPLPPHHQLSPKLSSISSGPLLCCFHQWLSESDHNDMLSSTCAGNAATSKTFFKALSQFFNSIARAWPSKDLLWCRELDFVSFCRDNVGSTSSIASLLKAALLWWMDGLPQMRKWGVARGHPFPEPPLPKPPQPKTHLLLSA